MRGTKTAFRWIVALLRKQKIPFEITGGLAAELCGSKRLLADIDIDVPERGIKKLVPLVQRHIVFGPAKYRDRNWNLLLMTLKYKNQLIDICGLEHTKIFDHTTKRWVKLKTDFSKRRNMAIFGSRVPIESCKELVAYKKKLGRRVDAEDIRQIKG